MAMTSSERSSKWWKAVKADPVRHEALKKKKRDAYGLSIYNKELQKIKADEILRKVGLK